MLDLIARNTVAVLTSRTEVLRVWLGTVQANLAKARQLNDAPMIALLGAVEKLLLGDDPADLSPSLEGPYAACWERIVEGLGDK